MQKDADHRLEELTRAKLDGKTYSAIREELSASGMAEEEIGRLIRKVDERVLKETVEQGTLLRTQQWLRWGLILAVAGLLLTIAYRSGMILSQLPSMLIYAPFVAGILLMLYGRMLQKKIQSPTPRGPSPIRKKRPYK